MNEVVRRIIEVSNYLSDNPEEVWGESYGDDDIIELIKSGKMQEVYNKYFPFVKDYISDPNFIPSLKLDELEQDDFDIFIYNASIIFPRELFHKIFEYYRTKKPDIIEYATIITREDVDYYRSLGLTEDEIVRSVNFAPTEEIIKYLLSLKTKDGVVDKDFYDYLMTEKIGNCLFLVIEEIKKGNYKVMMDYINSAYSKEDKIKNLVEALIDENLPNTPTLLDKVILLSGDNCSVLTDMEKGKKLISLYGPKYIVLFNDPPEELVSMIDDFKIEDYTNIKGDYKKSPYLLKLLIKKGEYQAIEYTKPDAITTEIINMAVADGVDLTEYERIGFRTSSSLSSSLAYNKYLASQGRYDFIHLIHDIYTNVESFDFVYNVLGTVDIEKNGLELINALHGKPHGPIRISNVEISKEVAERIVSLGFTIEEYIKCDSYCEPIVKVYLNNGDRRAELLRHRFGVTEAKNATYEDYLSLKAIYPSFNISRAAAIKLIKEGHYDVFDNVEKFTVSSVLQEIGLEDITEEEYEALPERVKEVPKLKERFVLPSQDEIIARLEEEVNRENITLAIRTNLPYETIMSYINRSTSKSYIEPKYAVKYLKEGHRDVINYIYDTHDSSNHEYCKEIVALFYELVKGELPTEEEYQNLSYSLRNNFKTYYISKGKYEIVELDRNRVCDSSALELLKQQNYSIEDFKRTPIFNIEIIEQFIKEGYVDEVIESIQKHEIKIEYATDFILSIYRLDIPRDKFKIIASHCDINIPELLVKLKDNEMDILNYLNLEKILRNESTISAILDTLDPKKIEELLQSDVYIPDASLFTIISSMVEKGDPSFVRFYKRQGNEKVLRKVLLSGYMPPSDAIRNSSFLSKKVPNISFPPEEKEIVRTHLESNPRYIIYLLDDYKDDKTKIIDCILKEPEVIELLPDEFKRDVNLVIEVAKRSPSTAASLLQYFDDDERIKIIEANHEVVKHMPSKYLTESIAKVVIPDSPEIIEEYSFPSESLIELAFKHGYKLTAKSPNRAVSYALQNNIEIPVDIWNGENIHKLFDGLTIDRYKAEKEKFDSIFDGIYENQKERFIAILIASDISYTIAIPIIERYGYTQDDYYEFKVGTDEERVLFVMGLKKLENLTPEEQVQKIKELLKDTRYKDDCFTWLSKHGLIVESRNIAKNNYEQEPLTYIKYVNSEDIDEDFIERTKVLIKDNPSRNYTLAKKVKGVLLDKEIALKVISYDGYMYQELSEELKRDSEIIDALLKFKLSLISYVPEDIPDYKDLCYKVLEQEGKNYSLLPSLFTDKKAFEIALKTYPEAIYCADISIIDDDTLVLIADFSSINLSSLDISIVKKIISLDSFDINNKDLMIQVLDLVVNEDLSFDSNEKILKGFIRLLNNSPEIVYKKYYKLLLQVDESQLTEEQIKVKNDANQLLEAYGKINTLDKNPVFSYDIVKYVLPSLGIDNTVNLMRYNSGADKEIINILKNGDKDLANAYFALIQKYHVFANDDKLIHFAFRYFSNYRSLIVDIIDKELSPQEVSNLIKVIMNKNPYNITTRDELTRYDEIVDEYARNMLTSPNLYEVKEYFARSFGFTDFSKFEVFFKNHQLDNFPQINYVLKDVKEKFGEELADSLRFTPEELKLILLMKEVVETENVDELHQLLQVNMEKENHILDYSDIVNTITLKVRKLYNYQFNAHLTQIDSIKSPRSEHQKTITDYRGQQKEASYTIIDMSEEPFKFLVHRIYHYDQTMNNFYQRIIADPSLWTKLDGASTVSASSISDKGFWMVEKTNPDGLIYIFDEMPEDFMLYMYGRDLYVEHGGHKLEPTSNHNGFTDIDSLNQSSCTNHHGNYNEVAGFRAGVMPKAILCNGQEPTEAQIRAADYFGIPIIRADMAKYERLKQERYSAARASMQEKSSVEAIYDIMYSGLTGSSISDTIDYCIGRIRASYLAQKITYEEMLSQLIEVRQLANRISEPNNKQVIRKVDLIIQTIALEKSVSQDELIQLEEANMGESGIMYRLHEGEKEYLLKPSVDKQKLRSEPFRAEIQKSASKLQEILSPDTAVPVEVLGTGAMRVSKQERLTLSSNPGVLESWANNGGELDHKMSRQLLQEYVIDFLLCNFDCFAGNFVVDSNDNLRGVDKEQSFRFIDDEESLDPSFSYVPNGLARIPIYKTLFERYQAGQIDLDFSIIDEKLAILEEMTDAEYEDIFRPYAEALNKEHPEIILDKIVKRKHICEEKLREFINSIRKDKPIMKGETL